MPKGSGKAIPKVEIKKELPPDKGEALLKTLKERFEKHMKRHNGIEWAKVQAKLEANPDKLKALHAMEQTGGEPDVVGFDKKADAFIFYDCSPETPDGRKNICYDGKGQAEREKKGVNPAGNAVDIAAEMGIELLTEEEYRQLQKLGEFDLKTSSWLKTPDDIRKLGGAIFADRRFGHVFVYHNTAATFYSNRAFRGSLKV